MNYLSMYVINVSINRSKRFFIKLFTRIMQWNNTVKSVLFMNDICTYVPRVGKKKKKNNNLTFWFTPTHQYRRKLRNGNAVDNYYCIVFLSVFTD